MSASGTAQSRGVAVAAGYASTLLVVGLVVGSRSLETARQWQQWSSTNLDNLQTHPVPALVLSGVVTDGSGIVWAGPAFLALWAACRVLGTRRAVAVVVAVHVVATLVSEGIVWLRIRSGAEEESARAILDVGPSYVVVAALVVAVLHGGRRERILGAAVFGVLASSLFGGLADWDVAAVGHCCSIVLAVVLGAALRRGTWLRRSRES